MISFVFSEYVYYYSDYLQKLHCFCLVVNPNTLGGKPKVYYGTNLGGKPRFSCIRTLFVLFFLQTYPPHTPKHPLSFTLPKFLHWLKCQNISLIDLVISASCNYSCNSDPLICIFQPNYLQTCKLTVIYRGIMVIHRQHSSAEMLMMRADSQFRQLSWTLIMAQLHEFSLHS